MGLLLLLVLAQDPEPAAQEAPDPRKEIPRLCKVLERGETAERREALDKLKEYGEQAFSRTRGTLRRLRSNWLRLYKNARTRAHIDIRNKRPMDRIQRLRKELMSLFEQGNKDAMVPLAKELMVIFFPDLSSASADPKVVEAQARLVEVEGMLGEIGEKTEDIAAEIAKLAKELDDKAFLTLMPVRDAKIIHENRELGKKIQENEYDFVIILNRYRVGLGRNALKINVKLCKAARGHSKDMVERGFFSHTSPVPGKRTHQDRAAREGTYCRSENISKTGTRGEDPFWSWFTSPSGHHKNMLNAGGQVGIGNFKDHWTSNY